MPRQNKGPRLYLRKRKSRPSIWVVRDGSFEESTGCTQSRQQDAEKALQDYIAEKWEPDTGQRNQSNIYIVEVLTLFELTKAIDHKHPDLAAIHTRNLMPFWGEKSLNHVNAKTCHEFTAWRCAQTHNGKNISPSTCRRELAVLQSAINHWHKQSPLASVPIVTKPKQGPARQRVLSRNEAARMLLAARSLGLPHIARFILIGLYTGTRHGAITAMQWMPSPNGGWFDLENEKMYRRGFGDRESSKRRPPTRIPARLMAHLKIWQRHDHEQGIVNVINWKGQPIKKTRKAWNNAVALAGLGNEVTPHTLRHTCATWALREGLSIWDVSALIGASIDTIEATYGHHSADHQQAVSGAFSGASANRKTM